MDRVGCISLSQLPLQILMRAHPEWAEYPVAVTKEDKPTSHLTQLNAIAKQKGIRIGTRYSEALSLVPDLRAGIVSSDEIRSAVDEVTRILNAFSPDIEPCSFDSDAIWVNVKGMGSLFRSPARWATAVRTALEEHKYHACVIVGFTRFGTYGLSRSHKSLILRSVAEESEAMAHSVISAFPLPARSLRLLERLGIRTVRDFQALPGDGVLKRFGKETKALFDVLRADQSLPVRALVLDDALVYRKHFDSSLFSHELLMEHVVLLVQQVLARVRVSSRLISELQFSFRTEDGETSVEHIRPARATQNERLLLRLVDLRLASKSYQAGVEEVSLCPTEVSPSSEQHDLFGPIGSSAEAGAQAFALIRARFGNDAVAVARLTNTHTPETAFMWEPLERPPALAASIASARAAEVPRESNQQGIRRVFLNPPVSTLGTHSLVAGPFVVSGEWWQVNEGSPAYLNRQYSFHLAGAGDISWVRHDLTENTSHVLGIVD